MLAETGVIGSYGAVNIRSRKDIASAENPAKSKGRFAAGYGETLPNHYMAA